MAKLRLLIQLYLQSYAGLSEAAWLGIIFCLLESVIMGLFCFIPIYLVDTLHISIKTAGLIISIYGMGTMLGGFISGKLSDRFSPSKVSAYSLLIQAIIYVAMIYVQDINGLMTLVFILGVAAYSFITSNQVWTLAQCNESDRVLRSINLLSTAANLGIGISAILMMILGKFGFQAIFKLASVLLLAMFAYIGIYGKNTLMTHHQTISPVMKEDTLQDNKVFLWIALTCVLLTGAVVSQTSSTYPLFLQSAFPRLGIDAISILFAVNCFLIVICEVPIGHMVCNSNKILTLGLGAFLIGVGMCLLSFSYTFSIAILACIIYTFGEILFFCMAQYICYQGAKQNKKGHSLGLYRTVYAGSRIAGPAIGGLIYQNMGGNMVWYLCGLIGVTCLLGCQFFAKKYENRHLQAIPQLIG